MLIGFQAAKVVGTFLLNNIALLVVVVGGIVISAHDSVLPTGNDAACKQTLVVVLVTSAIAGVGSGVGFIKRKKLTNSLSAFSQLLYITQHSFTKC